MPFNSMFTCSIAIRDYKLFHDAALRLGLLFNIVHESHDNQHCANELWVGWLFVHFALLQTSVPLFLPEVIVII